MSDTNSYYSNLRIISHQAAEDFTPDGNLKKQAWKKAAWQKFDHDAFTTKRYPQSETGIASVWTPKYVYFAFRCKYDKLNIYEGEDPVKERWELWNRDVVEVFANPDPARVKHYYEFEVSPNNQWIDLDIDLEKTPFNDAKWDSNFEHATHVDAKRHVWTCEMRIPVQVMNSPQLQPGAEWRLNFYRADGPGGDTQRRFLSWSPIHSEKHSFHAPASFGIIQFKK